MQISTAQGEYEARVTTSPRSQLPSLSACEAGACNSRLSHSVPETISRDRSRKTHLEVSTLGVA